MEELTESVVYRFSELFKGFKNRFGSFEIPPGQPAGKQKGIAKTLPGPLQASCYTEHLKGEKGLGVIPLLDDNESAKFGCIDIDKYPMDFDKLERDCKNLPIVITKSKSGGAHIWLFTKTPVPAVLIQDVLKVWAADLGFGKSEIFPKQTRRLGPDDAGNWINLPYYGGTRVAFFNGQNRSIKEFLDYIENTGRMMNEETLRHFLKTNDNKELFHDGPPCLATLSKKGLGPGSRNMVLLNVGSYFKKKDPANFLHHLLEFNKKHVLEPLPESEIHNSIAKSLQRKTYPYQCNQEPLCSACNRSACLKREFGVGGSSEELEITVTGLTKILTEPPTWFINIDGVRVEMTSIETLISQKSFRLLTAETINKLFPMIKASAWERTVQELLDTVEEIEAPEDSSFGGQLGDSIREFLRTFVQEDSFEQILAHTVYVDRKENRAYFKSSDLMRLLKKNLGNMGTPQRTWAYLKSHKEYDVKNEEHNFENAGPTRLWSVCLKFVYIPSSNLQPPPKVIEVSQGQETPF